jgi:hypothetical protein
MIKVTNPHNPRKPQHIHAMTVCHFPAHPSQSTWVSYCTVLRKSSVPDAVSGDYVPRCYECTHVYVSFTDASLLPSILSRIWLFPSTRNSQIPDSMARPGLQTI